MKHFVITTLLFFSVSNLFAQKAEHISFDLKTNDSFVKSITPIKGIGIVVEVCNHKPEGVDLVFYDLKMTKKWTVTFTKDDLHMVAAMSSNKIILAGMRSYIRYSDGKIIFINDLSRDNIKSGLTVCVISMDGKVEKKWSDIADYDGLIQADDEDFYLLKLAKADDSKSKCTLNVLMPESGKLGAQVMLRVPALKSGAWNYAGYDDGKLFFYGIEESSQKNNKANGFDVVFAPVNLSGELDKPLVLNVKLDKFFPSPEEQGSPALYVRLDTATHAMYTYCNMASGIAYAWVGANKSRGIYVQKWDLDGNLKWSKQYTNEELEATNPELKGEPVSYSSFIDIDDSTHNIVLVRQELAGMKMYNSAKCFLLDEDGNLKKAFMGADQSCKFFNGNGLETSAFLSCYPYKQGDSEFFEKIHKIFAPFPQGKTRPSGKLIIVGSKYWLEVEDDDKNTFDIYEL